MIYLETTGAGITRQEFLFELAEELAMEYQQELGKDNQPIPLSQVQVQVPVNGKHVK